MLRLLPPPSSPRYYSLAPIKYAHPRWKTMLLVQTPRRRAQPPIKRGDQILANLLDLTASFYARHHQNPLRSLRRKLSRHKRTERRETRIRLASSLRLITNR